jgi:SAM-dependent methyltransferase
MTSQATPETRRFSSAAPHYLKGRPAYSATLIRDVVLLCGLNRKHRVMDLGCGPGPLAVALASFVGEVVGIDPEPAMLEAAAAHATRAGVKVRLVQGDSERLGPSLGRFRAITVGRAFHWMDRSPTLGRLDALVETEGAVVLFRDRHPDLPDNAWRGPYQELVGRYAVDDEARARRKSPDWLPDEAVLLASPFSRLERIAVIERRRTPVESFVDRAFSMSGTAPGRIGARADALAREILRLMDGCARGGMVTEIVETEALIARRPVLADC